MVPPYLLCLSLLDLDFEEDLFLSLSLSLDEDLFLEDELLLSADDTHHHSMITDANKCIHTLSTNNKEEA